MRQDDYEDETLQDSDRTGAYVTMWEDKPIFSPPRHLEGRGRYRLKHIIGQGSMGSVYLAQVEKSPVAKNSEPFPSTVAIKILASSDSRPVALHRQEIGVMREVNHPNVVRVYDWGSSEGIQFAVLDYHRQGSLLQQLIEEGPVSAETAFRLARDLLQALVETHRLGMLHLDIKPGNVLLGEDGRFLLTDFGISQTLFQENDDRICGTPAYMSPEQARGENDKLDARSDLFSLGATLWAAILGDLPIKNQPMKKAVGIRSKESLSPLTPKVSEDYEPLARIIDQLTAFNPRSRPGSAAEVLALLEKLDDNKEGTDLSKDRGKKLTRTWRSQLRDKIADPVLRALLQRWGSFYRLRMFGDGEIICEEDEHSYDVYILLHGEVEVVRHDRLLAVESREGTIMGEVAALIGSTRIAMLRARGTTILASLNGAELEQACRVMPALAMRIMKSLAARLTERDQGRQGQ